MKIKLGSLEILIDIDSPSSTDVLELKLKEIINSKSITVRSTEQVEQPGQVNNGTVKAVRDTLKDRPKIPPAKTRSYVAELDALHAAGFPDKTIVMVANKVLGILNAQEDLIKDFGTYEKAANSFLSRPIDDDIWAIFAAPISFPGEPLQVAILGLNEQNQLIVLAIKENSPVKGFRDLINRGLDPAKIRLGVLSFHLGAVEDFKDLFPEAAVQLDWNEYIDLSVGAENKLKLRTVKDPEETEELISQIKAPRELLTYLDYPKSMHRPLRTTAPIRRLEKDVVAKLKKKGIDKSLRHLIMIWSVIRVQFYWLKIPVDSDQLANLKYIKSQNEADVE